MRPLPRWLANVCFCCFHCGYCSWGLPPPHPRLLTNKVMGLILLLLVTISCIYLFLTPNSRSVFCAGVSLNIQSFIHSFYVSDHMKFREDGIEFTRVHCSRFLQTIWDFIPALPSGSKLYITYHIDIVGTNFFSTINQISRWQLRLNIGDQYISRGNSWPDVAFLIQSTL